MKVSEVLDKLKIGDTVWVKAKVIEVDQDYDIDPIAINFFSDEFWLNKKDEISLIEPKSELVEVPQFVADWYEANKDDLEQALYETTIEISEKGTKNEFEDWFIDGSTDSYEILIRMKDGYTVKQEPKYIVKLPMVNWNDEASELQDDFAFLILDITSDETRISGSDKDFKTWIARLTEREIKSIDERYWAFAVPVDGSVEEA